MQSKHIRRLQPYKWQENIRKFCSHEMLGRIEQLSLCILRWGISSPLLAIAVYKYYEQHSPLEVTLGDKLDKEHPRYFAQPACPKNVHPKNTN